MDLKMYYRYYWYYY